MTAARRRQGERSAATRRALLDASRPLFAAHGFAGVSAEAIVRAAGVTRGAMYHHFADKTELFAAVFEAVEREATERIDRAVAEADEQDPIRLMKFGASVWLDVSAEPAVQRIAIVDAPSVLGHARWREIGLGYAMGLVLSLIEWAISAGRLPPQPPQPLAHVMLGALDEAVLFIAQAEDRVQARHDVGVVIDRLIDAQAADLGGPDR
ncbi:transcriptional regulator, TetR family [Jatrophihabitans endophyticus]|uniref:Transcriptional regulator, TetR family n=1 Tax=Jatrophihabitans endophyticus TaxID=1206085 RepID=A0A1M5UG27_9ACTN|nr:TetR/AcrR family transcriptional regulator [Jatrophihabitans endophyticus]SHH62005.1 transcriptional regulator, TetR family [Jatrophihabitans endophyticus]